MESRHYCSSYVEVKLYSSDAQVLMKSAVNGIGWNHCCCCAAVICLWLHCGRGTAVVMKPRPYLSHGFYTYLLNIQNVMNKYNLFETCMANNNRLS